MGRINHRKELDDLQLRKYSWMNPARSTLICTLLRNEGVAARQDNKAPVTRSRGTMINCSRSTAGTRLSLLLLIVFNDHSKQCPIRTIRCRDLDLRSPHAIIDLCRLSSCYESVRLQVFNVSGSVNEVGKAVVLPHDRYQDVKIFTTRENQFC